MKKYLLSILTVLPLLASCEQEIPDMQTLTVETVFAELPERAKTATVELGDCHADLSSAEDGVWKTNERMTVVYHKDCPINVKLIMNDDEVSNLLLDTSDYDDHASTNLRIRIISMTFTVSSDDLRESNENNKNF